MLWIVTPSSSSRSRTGASIRQGTHQEAKTLTSIGLPRRSALLSPASSRPGIGGRSTAGAGLPTSVEGSAPGSRPRPSARKTPRPAKTSSGRRKTSVRRGRTGVLGSGLALANGSVLQRGGRDAGLGRARRPDAQAPVGERDGAAQGHDGAAAPDPDHERVVVGADRPASLPGLVAEDDVEVAQRRARDAALGRRHPLDRVEALLGG